MNQLETERTVLRMFTTNDLDDLAAILSSPEVMKYLELDCQPISRKQTQITIESIIRHWKNHGFGRWAVICKEDGKLIGMAGFRSHEDIGELVYVLDEPYWGVGLATEIADAILKYGFEVCNFLSIIAMTRPENVASRRVMDKIGMRFEKEVNVYGVSAVQYSISREDYQSKQ
jgi:RimJ/RimL family protein N-acetyltransferase